LSTVDESLFSAQAGRLAAAGSLPTSTGNRDFAERLLVDFSHGNVGAFPPNPAAIQAASAAFVDEHSAYSPYRGHGSVRNRVAGNLRTFVGGPVDPDRQLIITPGTQGGLFLALNALIGAGEQVAIADPDYFADARIAAFIGATPHYVPLEYLEGHSELDLGALEAALRGGARVLCLSNPNNPTGVTYDATQLGRIADLLEKWNGFLISDELYSRLDFGEAPIAHAWSIPALRDRSVSLLGPSKTESLSGFRVGVAIGPAAIIDKMERIQSIVSLRAAGYAQTVLGTWLEEDPAWLANRIESHRWIRDQITGRWSSVPGLQLAPPRAGSYLFPRLPATAFSTQQILARMRSELGIVATDGAEFGPAGAGSFRINFSQDPQVVVAAAELMAVLIESQHAR
jgi:aspartate/methionine/tyrosine aminotransferase